MNFPYLTGEVGNIGIFKIKKRVVGGVVMRCVFTAPDNTVLTAYPWTDPLDIRVGSNQWSVFQNSPKIYSNVFRHATTGAADIGMYQCGVADCTIAIQWYSGNVTGSGVSQMYLLFRYFDSNNRWLVYFNGSGTAIILETTGGISTQRASGAYTHMPNTIYAISLILSGNNMSFIVDGTQRCSYSSAVGAARTIHGCGPAMSNVSVEAYIDNFLVTVP